MIRLRAEGVRPRQIPAKSSIEDKHYNVTPTELRILQFWTHQKLELNGRFLSILWRNARVFSAKSDVSKHTYFFEVFFTVRGFPKNGPKTWLSIGKKQLPPPLAWRQVADGGWGGWWWWVVVGGGGWWCAGGVLVVCWWCAGVKEFGFDIYIYTYIYYIYTVEVKHVRSTFEPKL